MKAAYDPKPKFRNTRSKFFKKTPSDEFNTTTSEAEKNTGTYWKNLGNQAYKEGNIQKALEHYSKAIVSLCCNIGAQWVRKHIFLESIKMLQTA